MNAGENTPIYGTVVEDDSSGNFPVPDSFVEVPADMPKQQIGMPPEDIRDPLKVRLLGSSDLAQALGISTQTLWRWTKSGYIPSPKYFGRNPYWHLASVQKRLAEEAA